jgi:glycosyltransferase involved in cell wall biosynthesis
MREVRGVAAPIAPIAVGEVRPRWSVMIPTYQCAGMLRQTLESVLVQDPGVGEMQIEVVDDASSDDVEAVVADVGRGRVGFFRQERNLGHVGNFNSCLRRSRGHLIHLLHGDDLVLPGFYDRLGHALEQAPTAGAAFCRYHFVDERGQVLRSAPAEQPLAGLLDDAVARLASAQRVQPPSIVVRRQVYEVLGGFDRRMATCGEDWEMWVRIASRFAIWYEPQILASYRRHTASLASRSFRSGQNLRDSRTAIRIFSEYLPADRAGDLTRAARTSAAQWGLAIARRARARGDGATVRRQLYEVLRTSLAGSVLRSTFRFLISWPVERAG